MSLLLRKFRDLIYVRADYAPLIVVAAFVAIGAVILVADIVTR